MLALAAACGVALLGVYAAAVWTLAGQMADTRAMLAVADALDGADWMATLLWLLSPASVVLATLAVVAAAVLFREVRSAAVAGAAVVGTVLCAEVLKLVLTRPSWLDDAGNSLPSGHVAAAAGLAAGALLAVPAALRPLVGTAGAIAVAATGLATMALGWHRPSDVVASVLLAAATTATAYAAVPRFDEPQ